MSRPQSTLSKSFAILAAYVRRSLDQIKDDTSSALRFDLRLRKEKELFSFDSVEALERWVVGSDADIGGLSEAYWGFTQQRTALFWGKLSTEVPKNANFDRSGYAGIRSKEAPFTLFSRPAIDTTLFRYLAIRARGDQNQWFVNLRTDSLYPSHVWQHRVFFQRPGEWETIMIPFRDFVLTSHGFVQPEQMEMNRSAIRTIGFSIVRQPGDFSLELEWIKALNTPETLGDFDIVPAKPEATEAPAPFDPDVAHAKAVAAAYAAPTVGASSSISQTPDQSEAHPHSHHDQDVAPPSHPPTSKVAPAPSVSSSNASPKPSDNEQSNR